MQSKFPGKALPVSLPPKISAVPQYRRKFIFKCFCCKAKVTSSHYTNDNRSRLKLMSQALGDNWKLTDIDANALQKSVSQWLIRTQSFFNDVTSPLVRSVNDRRPKLQNDCEDMDAILITEQTFDPKTFGGELSEAAIVSVEQFSRMNGLTGKKMQKIFKAIVPESVYNDPRNFVEYSCFRFLSRNSANFHPSLKEPAFQRLIFTTMLAWHNPYKKENDRRDKFMDKNTYETKLVEEQAFVRIAPAVVGVADYPTAHNLFKALSGDEKGISFAIWSTYINELVKVHEGRESYQSRESLSTHVEEKILCLASSRKQPVIKYEKNTAWPGKVTLTDKALYFEAVGLVGERGVVRLDLTRKDSKIEKTRVGPLGSNVFDSAICVTSGPEFDSLVLEFVDLGGEMRRDVWFTFIHEVISLHRFISEFGPRDDMYVSNKGRARAASHTANSIATLQALQFMRRTAPLDDPSKLVQLSCLHTAPYGDVVLQALAVSCWGGPGLSEGHYENNPNAGPTGDPVECRNHLYDVDGSVYLRKWMTSGSWGSSASVAFWKNAFVRRGVVLGKNLVVGGTNLTERAAVTCRDRCRVAEKTWATIDAATIKGIPSNIDLFKEIVFPLTLAARSFERLRRWEDPLVTASFLALVLTLVYRNLLWYAFPATLMVLGVSMLLVKGLKEEGRLGRYFGKVTIYDQPPSNTIQKIIALKEAMLQVEKYLQDVNVVLLKLRSVIIGGQPKVTMEVALALLFGSAILLVIPFKYILALVILHVFTGERELEFRRAMVAAFTNFLKERWDIVPAAPLVVLPRPGPTIRKKRTDNKNQQQS